MSDSIKIAPNGQWQLTKSKEFAFDPNKGITEQLIPDKLPMIPTRLSSDKKVEKPAKEKESVTKNDGGTGMVKNPIDLSRVNDPTTGVAAPAPKITPQLPKITPQPAERVGLAHPSTRASAVAMDPTHIRPQSGTQLYGSPAVTPDHTVIRPQSGTQLYAMNQAAARTTHPSQGEKFSPIINPHADVNKLTVGTQGKELSPWDLETAIAAHDNAPKSPAQYAAPAIAPVVKDEEGKLEHCSHCKKKPCVCIKTDGVLVDKMEKSDPVKAEGQKPHALKTIDWNRSDGAPDHIRTSHGSYRIHHDKSRGQSRLEYVSGVTGRSHDLGTHPTGRIYDQLNSHHQSIVRTDK